MVTLYLETSSQVPTLLRTHTHHTTLYTLLNFPFTLKTDTFDNHFQLNLAYTAAPDSQQSIDAKFCMAACPSMC